MNIFDKHLALSGRQGRLINPYFVLGIQYDFARQHAALLPELMRKMLKTLMSTYHPDKLASQPLLLPDGSDPAAYAVQLARALDVLDDPDSLKLARQAFFDAGASGQAERQQQAERKRRQQAEHRLSQLQKQQAELREHLKEAEQRQEQQRQARQRWQNLALYGVKRQAATPLWAIDSLKALSIQALPVADTDPAAAGLRIIDLLQDLDQLPGFTQWHYHSQRQHPQQIQRPGRRCELGGQLSELHGAHNAEPDVALQQQLRHWLMSLHETGYQRLYAFSLSTGTYQLQAPKRLARTVLAGKKAPNSQALWAPVYLGSLPMLQGLRCQQYAREQLQATYLPELSPAPLPLSTLADLPALDPLGLMPGDWLVYAQDPREDWLQAQRFCAELLVTAIQLRP